MNKKYLLIVITCLFTLLSQAQSDTSATRFTIGRIYINGNRITKPYIVLRELTFKEGDTITLPQLVSKFDSARQQLYNTRLFNEVIIAIKQFSGYVADVQIDLKERWYIFPLPYIKPVDRNLSAWADRGYSLDRLNYGVKLSWYNFTGRNDKLKLWVIGGYSSQLEFLYEQPYADKSLKHGFSVRFLSAKNKEVNALTVNDKQFFLKADSVPYAGKYLSERLNFTLGYTYRPAIRTKHSVKLGISHDKIDSAVRVLNPHYFANARKNIWYPELSYTINYNKVDYVAYPLKGFLGEAGISKKGFTSSMNIWELYGKGTRGWQVAKKTWLGLQGYASLKLPFDQPFYNSRQFGYSDLYLQGLEKYVIDGVAAALVRNTLRRELVRFTVPTYLRSRSHDKVPFRIYGKVYGNAGYVYNKNFPGNVLVNRMLYTGGAGIDVVTLYDVVVRFEYSFNQLGQNGLFLHIKNDF